MRRSYNWRFSFFQRFHSASTWLALGLSGHGPSFLPCRGVGANKSKPPVKVHLV